MSLPEEEVVKEEQVETEKVEKKEVSEGVKYVSGWLLYVLTAPLYLVKEISLGIVSLSREKLKVLQVYVLGFHIIFMVSDLLVMIYKRSFDFLSGTPSFVVKGLSLFLSYLVFSYLSERITNSSNRTFEKMDIKLTEDVGTVELVPLLEAKLPVEETEVSFMDQPTIPTESDFREPSISELLGFDTDSDDFVKVPTSSERIARPFVDPFSADNQLELAQEEPLREEKEGPSSVEDIYKFLYREDD